MRTTTFTTVASLSLLALLPSFGAGRAEAAYARSVGGVPVATDWGHVVRDLIDGRAEWADAGPTPPAPETPSKPEGPTPPSPGAAPADSGGASNPSSGWNLGAPQAAGLGTPVVLAVCTANELLFLRGCSSRPVVPTSRLFRPPRA
ncbi:MAG: hypothetical protein ACRC33_32050 [Gemmataceae bacterium]